MAVKFYLPDGSTADIVGLSLPVFFVRNPEEFLEFTRARAESFLPQTMADADLINALAQYLEFDPVERQALLEQPGPVARCRAMMELLEVKALLEQLPSRELGNIH